MGVPKHHAKDEPPTQRVRQKAPPITVWRWMGKRPFGIYRLDFTKNNNCLNNFCVEPNHYFHCQTLTKHIVKATLIGDYRKYSLEIGNKVMEVHVSNG